MSDQQDVPHSPTIEGLEEHKGDQIYEAPNYEEQNISAEGQQIIEGEKARHKKKKDKKHKKDKKEKKSKKSKKRKHHERDLSQDPDAKQLLKEIEELKNEQGLDLNLNAFDFQGEEEGRVIQTRRRGQQQQQQDEDSLEQVVKKRGNKKQRIQEDQPVVDNIPSNYNNKQRDAYERIKLAKKSKKEKVDENMADSIAKAIVEDMATAAEEDRKAYQQGRPALKKLMLATEVYQELRKAPVQETFLTEGGCDVISQWLEQMPDGTFPNINLVQGLLECVDGLKVDERHLEDSKLEQAIQIYATSYTGKKEVQKLAQSINDKWSRLKHGIRSNYDKEGDFDTGYRRLQEKLQVMRNSKQEIEEEDDEETTTPGQDKQIKSLLKRQPSKNEDLGIQKTRIGIILPDKNAFEFVERPERREAYQQEKKTHDTGKGKIQKTLLQLKKSNTKSTSNKGMATVKSEL